MAGTVHEVENHALLAEVEREAANAAQELVEAARLHRGQIVVIGCSTSEVVGHQVGSWSTPEAAQAIFRGLQSVFAPEGGLSRGTVLRAFEPRADRGARGGAERGDRLTFVVRHAGTASASSFSRTVRRPTSRRVPSVPPSRPRPTEDTAGPDRPGTVPDGNVRPGRPDRTVRRVRLRGTTY